MAPQGNASLPTHYAFRDENAPAHVTLYYRIQQVDLTGASTYSRTVLLSPNKSELFRWNIIGNPVRQQLQIQCTAAQPAEVWVRVADMQGRLIRQQKLQVAAGNATHAIPLLNLQAGSYTVQVQIPGWGISQTKIFVVEQ